MGHAYERANTFDAEKALAAIGYLVRESGADLYSVLKMVYVADKAHLGTYGRTITGDHYVAMKHGTVPDQSYNLCKFVRGQRAHFDAMPDARKRLGLVENSFELLEEPDLDALSKSDLQALDDALSVFKRGGWRALYRASHDQAWQVAWNRACDRGVGIADINLEAIAATLPNAVALVDYLSDPSPGEAEALDHTTD